MSETTELAAAETTSPAAEEKPRRRVWPLLAWGAVAAVIVTAGTVAALGTTGALIAGGCTAGAVAAGAVVWRLPQLRRHFARPRGASRMRSVQSRTRRMTLGGGRKGKLPGLGLGSGRKGGRLLPGGKGRAAAGKGLLGKGRAGKGRTGSGKGLLGKSRGGKAATGKGRAGGRSLLGKARSGAGRLLPGRVGRMLRGAGRKAGTGRGAAGGKPRGPVRRAVRRLLPGAGKRAAAARTGAGKKAAAGKAARKASPGRRAAGLAGTAVLLPLAGALTGAKKLRARSRKRRGKTAPAQVCRVCTRPGTEADPLVPAGIGVVHRSHNEAGEAILRAARELQPPPARQPGLPLAPSQADHPRRRKHPVSNQLQDTAEAIHQGIGGFEPENATDIGLFLQELPAVYEALTSGLNRIAERFGDEYPLHPAVVEHIRELASSAAGQHEYAGEAHHIFTTTHTDDLERLENPRPNERLWDVAENQ